MKRIALCLALIGLMALGGQAIAEICTIDDVPAATLLLPYFEVDLSNNNVNEGVNTLFSINNASAAAAIAHVTLWTDQSIPTLDFDIYLTGYDVQTISLRDIFNGRVPRTGDRGVDAGGFATADTLSPSPPIGTGQAANVNPYAGPFTPGAPTEFDFGGSSGPCVAPYAVPVLDPVRISNLRLAHTGLFASAYGGCLGADYGDNIARGYITVDSVSQCNLLFPSSTGYFGSDIADTRNILWGDYFYVNSAQNFAQGETLVHIESCADFPPPPPIFEGYVGNGGRDPLGAAWCPFGVGEYTFYGRYASSAGQDQREPLATTFASRYINGGIFSGGTDLIVWRDSKTIAGPPGSAHGPYNCATADGPDWFPLNQTDVVAFDEDENPTDLCRVTTDVSPPPEDQPTCFPLEAQRVSLVSPTGPPAVPAIPGGSSVAPPAPFGWIYLNLNTTVTGVTYPSTDSVTGQNPSIAQAWVTTIMDADGRFSVGFDAIQLDSACQPNNLVFIP